MDGGLPSCDSAEGLAVALSIPRALNVAVGAATWEVAPRSVGTLVAGSELYMSTSWAVDAPASSAGATLL